jgi:4'-phosphopantetheinyl transferase
MDSRLVELHVAVAELSRSCLRVPPVPQFSPSSIHLWEFPLTSPDPAFNDYAALLSADEERRAERFHFDRDRNRFTIGRGVMRSILGAYARKRPGDLLFDYSRYGKPSLRNAAIDIRFSVSHSGDLAMLAVALNRDLGVDIENIRQDVETDHLAERFFSPRERESLRALPAAQRVAAFFRCWTCKEAFLKAQGFGLSRSLDSFDVEVDPAHPARLLATRPDATEAASWFLHDLEAEQDYKAALAVQDSISKINLLRCR